MVDGDKIAEQGTHQELMACKGIYADMYSKQAAWLDDPKERLAGPETRTCSVTEGESYIRPEWLGSPKKTIGQLTRQPAVKRLKVTTPALQ